MFGPVRMTSCAELPFSVMSFGTNGSPDAVRRSTTGWRPSTTDSSSPSCICGRSEEHTSELQSRVDLVCRLLLEKKKKKHRKKTTKEKINQVVNVNRHH